MYSSSVKLFQVTCHTYLSSLTTGSVPINRDMTLDCHTQEYLASINCWVKYGGDMIIHDSKYETSTKEKNYKALQHVFETLRVSCSGMGYGKCLCGRRSTVWSCTTNKPLGISNKSWIKFIFFEFGPII